MSKQSNQVLKTTTERYILLTNFLHAQFSQPVASTINANFLYSSIIPALASVNIAIRDHPEKAAAIKSTVAKHFFANTLLNKVVAQKDPQYDSELFKLLPKEVNDKAHLLLQENKVTLVGKHFDI